MNGARQVECTINGLGERAGNASLEEIVMAVRTRKDVFPLRHAHRHDADRRGVASWSSAITGFPVQPNKAIVGANAFAHESGIHQDGVIKQPRDLRDHARGGRGLEREQARAGQARPAATHSRRGSSELGIDLGSEDAVNIAFAQVQGAGRQEGRRSSTRTCTRSCPTKHVTPEREHYKLVGAESRRRKRARCRTRASSLVVGDSEHRRGGQRGDGPVDAVFKRDRADGALRIDACFSIRSTRSRPAATRRAK